MKKLLIIPFLFLFLSSCAHKAPTIPDVIKTTDNWWMSIRTENPHYYKVIKLCNINIHLCGSRAKLWFEYNKLYPNTPFDLSSNTYMFTLHDPRRNLIEIWLVGKVINDKVILHKWAAGHELVRLLSLFSEHLQEASKY